MQRIKALIEKLNVQYRQKASPGEMLITLQMLQKELTGGIKEAEMLGTSAVTVLIPNAPSVNRPRQVELFGDDDEKVVFELPMNDDVSEEEINELLLQQSKSEALAEMESLMKLQREEQKKTGRQASVSALKTDLHNVVNEVPTFTQYAKLNTTEQAKPAAEPKQMPKLLKKSITNDDRQLFLKKLFRGDKNMYERSIKTIDNFQAYAEAEYWIRRELKTKLGWLPDDPAVQQFDQLVKKRFS